ncbi:unnamed protein product [Urochloa humidicola]
MSLSFLGPLICFALALRRLRQFHFADPDVSNGNMNPALISFYWLIMYQFLFYVMVIIYNSYVGIVIVPMVREDSRLTQEWGHKSVMKYLSDTTEKCWREWSPASIAERSLSRYAADLLDSESESWEDNLLGARMLATFIKHGADVRALLLPSRPKIQKLIDTVGWRGRGDSREMRECAAGIVAHLAGDIHLPQFPGALRCISSLLQDQTTLTYWDSDQQDGTDKRGAGGWINPIIWKALEANTLTYWDWDSYQQVGDDGGKKGGVCNKLILQGLAILERLASDHHNCSDICSDPGVLSKIMAPLYSSTFSGDINISDWALVVNAAFKVIYQLIIHAPRDISTRLRLDISSNEQAMNNLKGILDQGTAIIGLETQEELLMRAIEILTELALDSSVDLTSETKENLIKKQLQIFLADQGTQEPDSRTNPLIVTAGRTLVLLTGNSKTNSDFILKACDSDSLAPLTRLPDDDNTVALPIEVTIDDKKNTVAHLTELLDATNNITYRTIAAEILENNCTHCDWDKHKQIMKELVLPKVLIEIMSNKSDQSEGKISDEKENKPQSWTSTHSQNKNNRGNQKNFVPPGKDEENQQNIAPGNKSMIQEISSSGDQKKSSDEQKKEQTAKKELQEALLSLALVICDKLISAYDVIQEKALGGDAFVVKLKTIIDDNCKASADSLRIVKLCGRIAASMMQSQPYADRFRNKKFAQSLTKASEIMSNLESCMIFAGTDFGPKRTVRPLLSELEKKISDLEKKEVQLVRG